MYEHSFFTLSVHAGEDRDANFGALSVPIYPASVFAFSDADEGVAIHNYEKPGYFYGRLGNPTVDALEKAMAELERGEAALALASGMAAVSAAAFTLVNSGDHVVAPESMYSTTTNFLNHIGEQFGIETTYVNAEDAEAYAAAIRPNTKMFWVESPSNPLVKITDIAEVSAIGKRAGIATVVDNTFATPYNQRPLELGADLVIHSATKYLGGHSDLSAGIIVGGRDLVEKARHGAAKYYGGNIAPQVAWLVLRGIKTLALRMERHNSNASALAYMLCEHPKVMSVHYPGLESHRNHEIAKRQMHGFGGMLGVDVGTVKAAKSVVNSLKVCTFATSLGGVETLIQPVALMTHATLSPEDRAKAGVSDGLLRISVGIEHVDDICRDIYDALG
ncbi:MAG: PLP-dependent transferase [Blastocatellia bacterium]|nr:PLP-dependent transferase [Chloracidobacterium sp.]MBL8184156.1 PLP-dependent transferase [Blastocatellia bacterium]HBE82685.1 methionine gamma-lyase [Blastocatellia bacterium]HRJ88683.1 PLP-dependent aspartate aminotransferase family protein [Pyrinomonadaceae bacterium]HRK49024.1 PLP-dependent aspartate aminotransferase family protein [Pyrinomonadaceae bacterium]